MLGVVVNWLYFGDQMLPGKISQTDLMLVVNFLEEKAQKQCIPIRPEMSFTSGLPFPSARSQSGLLCAGASKARPQHPAPGGSSARHSPVCPETAEAGSGPCSTNTSLPTVPRVIAVSLKGLAGFSGSCLAFGVQRAPRPCGGECCRGGRQRVARGEWRGGRGPRAVPSEPAG